MAWIVLQIQALGMGKMVGSMWPAPYLLILLLGKIRLHTCLSLIKRLGGSVSGSITTHWVLVHNNIPYQLHYSTYSVIELKAPLLACILVCTVNWGILLLKHFLILSRHKNSFHKTVYMNINYQHMHFPYKGIPTQKYYNSHYVHGVIVTHVSWCMLLARFRKRYVIMERAHICGTLYIALSIKHVSKRRITCKELVKCTVCLTECIRIFTMAALNSKIKQLTTITCIWLLMIVEVVTLILFAYTV